MKIKKVYLFISFLTISTLLYGQWGDCSNSFDACSLPSFSVTPSGYGNTEEFTTSSNVSNPQTNPNPSPGNMGCLQAGELNSTWLLITAVSSGTLEFSLGDNNGSNFYDWIMWPYNSNTCTDIYNNTLPPAACNWNGAGVSFTGMADPNNLPTGATSVNFENPLTVNAGDQYILCFSNYSGAQTSVPLNFFGTSNISCGTTTGDTICIGDTALITASDGVSYTWDNTVPGFISSTPNGDTAFVNPTITTIYPVVITFSGGGTLNDSAEVIVVDNVIVDAGLDTTLCPDEVLTLPATVTNSGGYNLTYNWTPSTGLNNPNTLNPNLTVTSNQTFYLTAYPTLYPQCISNTDSIIISLDSNFNIPYLIGDTITCIGNTVFFEAHNGITYNWENGNTDSTASFIAYGDTTIQMIATTKCGADTLEISLTVAPPPIVSSSADTTIAIDMSVELYTSGGSYYKWVPYDDLNCNTCDTVIATPNETTTYYIEIKDSLGCISYDTITVNVEYFPFFLPTGFSPNNDGNNDILLVRGSGIQAILLQIFDRYGNLVFESTDQMQGWDGTYKNKPVNTGVYIFNIDVQYKDGRTDHNTGNITLFR